MRFQQPFHISPSKFHPFERIGSLLDIWDNSTASGQLRLALQVNFRLRPPRLALFFPIGNPSIAIIRSRTLWWWYVLLRLFRGFAPQGREKYME